MKTICTLFFLSLLKFTFAQNLSLDTGETYAVVVGISDYQDPQIPDLRFADKDALAFANFLRSPAGGSLDEDHLKVLINEEATTGLVAAELYWLMEVSGKNDKVIIYFSGHGDAESKFKHQPGFLLCWDAPSRVYMSGGVIDLRMLQDVISAISIDNQSKVLVVTDACRSGKLSGSHQNGAQTANNNLAKKYANEIKILSCQPDEFSIEGEQWGGGRGAFSYHLLDGLYGMADGNGDLSVNLMEIGRYLEDKVSTEVAPESQIPMVVGNRGEQLTKVFPEVLTQLQEGRKGQMQLFTPSESRGIEEEVLAAADSNIVEMYLAFEKAIEGKQFLEPVNACADFYYRKLSKEPQLERLHSNMRRNYAAVLQDDAQQVLNRLIKSDYSEISKTLVTVKESYKNYPVYLRRAAELLGNEHYFYNELMARSYWFEAYLSDDSGMSSIKSPETAKKKVLPLYRKALDYQPEMPHAWAQIAGVYGNVLGDIDSAAYYANLAIEAVPNWTLVYSWIAGSYLRVYWQKSFSHSKEELEKYLVQAENWLVKGLEIDSNELGLLNELAYLYNITRRYEEEQEILDRAFNIEPSAYTMFFKGQGFISWKKYHEAEIAFKKAIAIDSSLMYNGKWLEIYLIKDEIMKLDSTIQTLLSRKPNEVEVTQMAGNLYYMAGMYQKSIDARLKGAELDPAGAAGYYHYAAQTFSDLSPPQYENAIKYHKKGLEISPDNVSAYVGLALAHLHTNNIGLIKPYLEKAFDLDSTQVNTILFLYYVQNGEMEEATKVLKSSMEKAPMAFPNAVRWYAYRFMNPKEKANKCFQLMLENYPDNAQIMYQYAIHLIKYENNQKAGFEQLDKALQAGYDNLLGILLDEKYLLLGKNRAVWDQIITKYFPPIPKK